MSDPAASLLAAIARHAQERPDEWAIVHPAPFEGWGRLTWRGLMTHVGCLADRMTQAGPVGWLQHNHRAALTTLLACSVRGQTFVPLNWRLSPHELAAIMRDCGMPQLWTSEDGEAARRRGLGLVQPWPETPLTWFAESFTNGDTAPQLSPARCLAEAARHLNAPLLLGYTSGTTGQPKGAVLTQAAMLANVRHAQAVFGFMPADRVLTVLPLFHLGGLCIQTLPALCAGATILLHPRFDADAFFDTMERDRPTLTLLVPAVMQALVAHPRWAGADLSSLRAVGAGSSEVPLPLIQAFHARGIPVQQVYGMTESGPIAIAQDMAEAWAAPGSIGRPVGDCEAQLDPATSEIQLRGPNLFSGYWNAPEATREAFTEDGWFRTGDVGRQDAEGRFWFTGRLKHLIISGGENIHPAELERVLLDAPGVAEAAVLGRPDPRWGEVPVAVVVPGPGFDADAVRRHCEGRLARFKQPRAIIEVAALPRTALGKVQVEALRKLVTAAG